MENNEKKDGLINNSGGVSATIDNPYVYNDTKYGEVQLGYNPQKNLNVRLVSNKAADPNFKVTGVKDAGQSNNWKAWLYLAPVLILMSVFLIYPLIDTIAISFMDNYSYVKGTFDGWSFANYGKVLGLLPVNGGYQKNFVDYAIGNTFFLVFVTVPISIFIAILISVGLNNLKWFQKVLQTVFFLPYVTNAIAIGMVFSVIFDQKGLINFIFQTDKLWIYGAQRWDAMLPLCIYIIWSSLPFKILVFLSGLQGIDKQYYQAAKIDATPQWKVLFKITIPLLSPQILYIMITSFIGSFKEYSSIVGLFNGPGTSNGSYEMYTVVYYVYDNISLHTELAAAAATMLFVVILLFTWLQSVVSKRRVYY
jgi:multiple sugar transport system permease protein